MSQLVGQGVAGVYPRDVFGDIGAQGVTHGAGAYGGLHKGADFLGGFMGTDILRSKAQMPVLSSRQVACTLMPSVGNPLRLPV